VEIYAVYKYSRGLIFREMEKNSMTIMRTLKEDELTVNMIGRLEKGSALKLEEEFKTSLKGVKTLIIDLEELEYISSEGLHVFFSAQKIMNKQGRMIVRNVNEDVMEVFKEIGAVEVLTIEKADFGLRDSF
jgi:anti-anti-sigma factor